MLLFHIVKPFRRAGRYQLFRELQHNLTACLLYKTFSAWNSLWMKPSISFVWTELKNTWTVVAESELLQTERLGFNFVKGIDIFYPLTLPIQVSVHHHPLSYRWCYRVLIFPGRAIRYLTLTVFQNRGLTLWLLYTFANLCLVLMWTEIYKFANQVFS